MRTSQEIYEQYSLLCKEAENSVKELFIKHGINTVKFDDDSRIIIVADDGWGSFDAEIDKIVLNKHGWLDVYEKRDGESVLLRDGSIYKNCWIYIYETIEDYIKCENK